MAITIPIAPITGREAPSTRAKHSGERSLEREDRGDKPDVSATERKREGEHADGLKSPGEHAAEQVSRVG